MGKSGQDENQATAHLRKQKPDASFFIFLLPFVIYLGYAAGTMQGRDVNLYNISDELIYAVTHPFPVRITWLSLKVWIFLLIAWGFGILQYIGNYRSLIPGMEYGTAKFAEPKAVSEELRDEDPGNNKKLSEHVEMSMDTRHTGLNNNVTVIGGSGSGKSYRVVKPNAVVSDSSMIFTDPKGELLRDLGEILEMKGFRIVSFNLVDMAQSDGYNPFDYIRSDNDIIKLVTNIMKNTTPKGSAPSDPFWDNALSLYLQAIMSYVWYECPKQGRNASVREMMELLTKAKVAEKDGDLSELDEMMDILPDSHPAKIAYQKVRSGAKDTIRSIIISAHARLAYLQNPAILRILDHDDVHIPWIGQGVYENPKRKTALFCVIPDNDKSYNFLVGMLYTQIFQELYYIADFQCGGALPVPVAFWMDEFANVALPDAFTEILSTMRSRNISCNIILQNRAQLQALFKDSWQSIIGNTDVLLYLGGNEYETHKYMTEMLGKYTVGKQSKGESGGSHGQSSSNYDVIGRDLLTTDEVRKLPKDKCLIFIRGFDPILDDKIHTYELPEWITAEQLGPYEKVQTESLYEEGEVHYYIDAEGDDAMEDSYRYQVENFHGIFAESQVFKTLQQVEDHTLLMPPQDYGRYLLKYNRGEAEILPGFDLLHPEQIYAGGTVLTKYPIVGYFEDEDVFVDVEQKEIPQLFTAKRRTRPVRKQIL